MQKRKKILKFIKINKIYNEMTESEEEELLSFSSGEQKEEEYSWTTNLAKKGKILKKNYLQYPFVNWNKIIKDKCDLKNYDKNTIYQETVNLILKEDVFKNETFKEEARGKNLFEEFLENLNQSTKETIKTIELETEKIKLDFYVLNMTKESFKSIITDKCFMFRYDKNYNKLEQNITNINIIGEIKTNPDGINNLQRQKYFKFCNEMNSKSKNEYYFTLYIFNISYEKFWYRNFHKNNPCIIGFIPKLYLNEYFNIYNILNNERLDAQKIPSENEENIFHDKDKRNVDQEKEDVENIDAKINPENNYCDNMNMENLVKIKRKVEDNILSLKRSIEDKEEELNKMKRAYEDSLLIMKRKREDEEQQLEIINKVISKKKKEDKD